MLLAPSGTSAARELLDRRGWSAREASEPLIALAELCVLERAARRGAERVALVVVEPPRWPQLPSMISAARRYLPEADLWSYDDGALVRLDGGPEAMPGPPPSDVEKPEPEVEISPEEIAMLLEDDGEDPPV